MDDVKLVPARMLLDKETIGAINFHCGDGGDNFGEHSDGLLWIGTATDDDGKEVYGLHLATAEYPEEGSTTLVEFAEPLDAQRLRADTAEAELAECKRDRDTEQRAAIEANANLKATEQRIAELTKSFEKFRDIVRGCERLASQYSPCIDAVDEGGDDNDDPTLAIFHRLYYAMFDADAALNPKPEAGSHEVAREALRMENQRIVPARFMCLACGEYHEGSGNLPCPKTIPYAGA